MENKIRQPIITVAGHVDHGKTSILDAIRKTKVYDTEAGGITQKISFTALPKEELQKSCPLLKKNNIHLDFPGFLFIDTPGHAAFSHLRKRGGSLADLAILVMDINEGIMPQTTEVIQILKLNKVPFVIALNKIDNIGGWKKRSENLKENIDLQSINTKNTFTEKLLTIMGSLQFHGFNPKPFYEISDFAKELALIPCSAKTNEGIPELIFTIAGLSQKYLKEMLKLGTTPKGVIFEIVKEISIASFNEPIISKIRVLEEILPSSSKFKPADTVTAATGIRMQLITQEEILPGMPFLKYNGNLNQIKEEFKKELGNKLETDEQGIIIKADSLGSLEALITLLRQENIQVV